MANFPTFKARSQVASRNLIKAVHEMQTALVEYEAQGGAAYSAEDFTWPDGEMSKAEYDALFYAIGQLNAFWAINGVFFYKVSD